MAPPRQGPVAPGRTVPGPFPPSAAKPTTTKPARTGPVAPPPPPPVTSKDKGEASTFKAFINDHPIMRPYSELITKWADDAGVDWVVAATLLWHESFSEAKRRGVDPNTIMSPTGEGYGPAQINPKVWLNKQTPWGETITMEKLADPSFNIRFGLKYFASLPGTVDEKYARYSGGANHTLSTGLPKGYVPTGGGLTKQEKGQSSAEQKAANATASAVLFDKWMVLGKDGKLKSVRITDASKPPANVLKYGPTPLTQSTFLQTWKQQYADTFFAYTGHQASGKQIATILKNAPSLYTLSNTLAKTPQFQKSPTFKAHAPGITEIVKQELGQDAKVDKAFVAKAIAQNWDQATLSANIKKLPGYELGPTFKDEVVKFKNVYTQIYGNETPEVDTAMKELARRGWTRDQVAAWLRTQPEYKGSQEFKSKALGFAQQLGLITGHMATLTADQAMLGGPPTVASADAQNVPAQVTGTFPAPPKAKAPAKVTVPHKIAGSY